MKNNEVVDLFQDIEARHVFGIVDSCFSGSLFRQRNLDEASLRQFNIPSRWLLTAGRLEPVSDGALGKHSPFAKSLITQLKYPDSPALWVSELCPKVIRGVSYNEEKQLPRGEPLQKVGHQGGEFVFFTRDADISGVLKKVQHRSKAQRTVFPKSKGVNEVDKKGLTYQSNSGAPFFLDQEKLEQSGLKERAELLIEKLNYLQEAQIRETDPSRKFQLKYEITELEQQLLHIQEHL